MTFSRKIAGLVLACASLSCTLISAPWSFAVFCDGRNAPGEAGGKDGVNVVALRAIAEDAALHHVEAVVFAGDLVNGSVGFGPLDTQFATWKEAMAPLYQSGARILVCRGNHDLRQDTPRGASLEAWKRAFPDMPRNGPPGDEGLTYSVDLHNACFIAMDQFHGISPEHDWKRHDSTVNKGMVSPWVIQKIKDSAQRWVFVFGHESAWIDHHPDCMASFPAERDAFWDALGARGGIYLSGHDHLYVRHTAPDSAGHPVLELVVGCAGATPYPFDSVQLNAEIDRHVVPTTLFVNAKKGSVPNSLDLPMYFGYVLITVDGDHLQGEWRAFTNYDTRTFTGPAAPEKPRFEAFDHFQAP